MKKRYSEDQIIGFLKEADAGVSIKDLCRWHGFSEASFYLWRSKYGGMEVSDAKRLKALEAENGRLKKLPAETSWRGQHARSSTSQVSAFRGRLRNSFTGNPASASGRKPMMCSSENRFFTSNLLAHGARTLNAAATQYWGAVGFFVTPLQLR